jgi:hypothetical protein
MFTNTMTAVMRGGGGGRERQGGRRWRQQQQQQQAWHWRRKARENIVQLQKEFTTDKLNVQLQNT